MAEGVVFRDARLPTINSAGDITFIARFSGPGVTTSDDVVVVRRISGILEIVAREGDPAPRNGTWRLFDTGGSIPDPFDEAMIDEFGNVRFTAELDGPGVAFGNHRGAWQTTATGLQLIVRLGDQLRTWTRALSSTVFGGRPERYFPIPGTGRRFSAAMYQDLAVGIEEGEDQDRFIRPLTGEITARVTWFSPEFAGSSFYWSVDLDEAVWTIE